MIRTHANFCDFVRSVYLAERLTYLAEYDSKDNMSDREQTEDDGHCNSRREGWIIVVISIACICWNISIFARNRCRATRRGGTRGGGRSSWRCGRHVDLQHDETKRGDESWTQRAATQLFYSTKNPRWLLIKETRRTYMQSTKTRQPSIP